MNSLKPSGSRPGALLLRGTFGNVWSHFWLPQLVGTISIQRVEAADAAKHPIMHRTAPYNIELFGPKCQ